MSTVSRMLICALLFGFAMSKHNHHHNDDDNQSGDSGSSNEDNTDDDNYENTFQPTNRPSPPPTPLPSTLPPTVITTASSTLLPTANPTMESTAMSTSLSAVLSQVPVIVEMGNAGSDNVGLTVMHLWPWFIIFGIFCCLGLCAIYLRRVMNREKEFSMISNKTTRNTAMSDMERTPDMCNHVAFASVSTVDEEAMIMDKGSDSETEYESEYIDNMEIDVVVDSIESRSGGLAHDTQRRTVYREEDRDEDVDDIETGVSLEIGGKQIAFPMSADVDDIVLDHGDDGNGYITSTKGKGKCMRKNGCRFQPVLQGQRSEGQLREDTRREGGIRMEHEYGH